MAKSHLPVRRFSEERLRCELAFWASFFLPSLLASEPFALCSHDDRKWLDRIGQRFATCLRQERPSGEANKIDGGDDDRRMAVAPKSHDERTGHERSSCGNQ